MKTRSLRPPAPTGRQPGTHPPQSNALAGSGASSLIEAFCPQAILDLVERFADHRDTYKKSDYNEAQVRREFIDPFFKALGWDIDNEQGHAEHYKDVIHEIDQLVYQPYELTYDEIKIVEEATN